MVSKALFKDNEPATAQAAMAEYEKVINLYARDLLTKPVDNINEPKGK